MDTEPAKILKHLFFQFSGSGTYNEGDYHQHLEGLSPDFDHLLAYSRHETLMRHFYKNNLTPSGKRVYGNEGNTCIDPYTNSSSVCVIDVPKRGGTPDYIIYDRIDDNSMNGLHSLLSTESDSDSHIQLRIIFAQHLTGPVIETLGSALSLDPNVFSCYIGNSFKASSKYVGRCGNCGGIHHGAGFPVKLSMGYCTGLNTDYHRNNYSDSVHDSLAHSVYSTEEHSTTFSISIPRTIYPKPTPDLNFPITNLMLQEPALSYHITQTLNGRRFTNFDTLQHATIHVENNKRGYRQVIVLFPPSHNDVNYRQEITSGKYNRRFFGKFLRPSDQDGTVPQYSLFIDDIAELAQSNAELKPAHVAHIVRVYAFHEWSARIRTLEDQLENLTVNCSISCGVSSFELNPTEYPGSNLLLDEEGMKNAILRYISALDEEIERLDLDKSASTASPFPDGEPYSSCQPSETAKKYKYIQRRMGHLLSRVQHSLDVKTIKINRDLMNLQIKESRKSIEQAETIKRLTTLAFIYIPLSFVSSAFGMNIREMDPQPSIWVFAVVAAVVTLTTVATAGYSHVVKFLVKTKRKFWAAL